MKTAVLLIATLLLAAVLLVLSVSQLEGFRGVAVIVLGPIPIFIDVSNPTHAILLVLPFIIFLLPLIFLLITRRRVGDVSYE